MEGKIFDIQRFSIYDGPGIRTNVFFKGCNLRCLWCHNPESQSIKNQLMFRREKCIGCGRCTALCGNTFTEACTACGKCVESCPASAREITGKTMTADAVVEAVLKDRAFYETSGGGVTLSGGEPLLQADFALEILRKCKENGLHTAVETAANVPWHTFEKVLPYLDMVLCDIKCIDEEKHKALTGVDNKTILENAEKLKHSGAELLFRMPVIPTCNDDEVEKVAAFTGDTSLEILAYHETGCGKYDALGMEYKLKNVPAPDKAFMQELADKTNSIYAPTGL